MKPYEALARAIGYQQLTAKAADAIIARLKALYPTPLFRRLRTSWSPELLARVATINGMGRWTVQMLLMYSLERMHILPADDFGVREGYRSLKSLPEQPEPNALREIGKAWAPHRTLAAWYLGACPASTPMSSNDGLGREGPMQNRVTPFGDIEAIPQRGMFTGNRGIIHDPVTKTLLAKRWASKAWLICRCDYKDRRRDVMAGRSWTELFFLDEAVALAAGHRPCFLCRRKAAELFRAAWAAVAEVRRPSAAAMDAVLHRERMASGRRRVHAMPAPLRDLPSGTVVVVSGAAYTIAAGRAFRWTECGYEPPQAIHDADSLLTPPSTFMALRAGYRPILHPTLAAFAAGATPL